MDHSVNWWAKAAYQRSDHVESQGGRGGIMRRIALSAIPATLLTHLFVVAGLDPAIHLLRNTLLRNGWMPGSSPGMTVRDLKGQSYPSSEVNSVENHAVPLVQRQGRGGGRVLRVSAAEFKSRQHHRTARRLAERTRRLGEGGRVHAHRAAVHGDERGAARSVQSRGVVRGGMRGPARDRSAVAGARRG